MVIKNANNDRELKKNVRNTKLSSISLNLLIYVLGMGIFWSVYNSIMHINLLLGGVLVFVFCFSCFLRRMSFFLTIGEVKNLLQANALK